MTKFLAGIFSTFSFSKDHPIRRSGWHKKPPTLQAGEKASLWEKAQEEGCPGADTGGQLSIAGYTPLDGGHLHRPVRLLCWHPDLLLLGCVSGTLLLPQVCQRGLLGNTFSLANTYRTHFNVLAFQNIYNSG